MTGYDEVPYSDPEPLSELIEDCRCVEGECAAHGVTLHPERHRDVGHGPAPVLIGETTQHIVDGYPDYGS
jgi:hypothetical protein